MTEDEQYIAKCVCALRERYIAEKWADSYWSINNGLCDEFADALEAMLEPRFGRRAFVVEGANFSHDGEGERWDARLLARWRIKPPQGFTWRRLNAIGFGAHVWVTVDNRHYDAECPEGADSFFELPLYQRYLVHDQRKRGIACEDVWVEDVVPPPCCPVPNPMEPAAGMA